MNLRIDRRSFLLGTAATLAATCLGKPALGPIWESPDIFAMLEEGLRKARLEEDMEALIDRLTQPLAKEFERCIMGRSPYMITYAEDRLQIKSIPLGDLYA